MAKELFDVSLLLRYCLHTQLLTIGTLICGLCLYIFQPLPVRANDFQDCGDCHGTILNKDMSQIYIHIPFSGQQCGGCHMVGVSASSSGTVTLEAQQTTQPDNRKIIWLEESHVMDTSHCFLIQSEKLGDTLVIELHETGGAISRQDILIPSLSGLPSVPDSGEPPTISDVRVLEVKHAIFISATIGWQTNTLTDALVRYSILDDGVQSSELDKSLGRRHEVTLYNLKPNTTYQFSVMSQDIFGRSQVSEPMTFSTAEPLSYSQPEVPVIPRENETGTSCLFQRFGDNYLVELTLDQAATIMIGSKGLVMQGAAENGACATGVSGTGQNTGVPPEEIESHAGLSSSHVISQEACKSCHEKRCTHPVDACPRPGMVIAPEYPVLPNGRISCISCHTSHSSDYPYLVRRHHKKMLCIGCHTDKEIKDTQKL